MRRDSAKSRTSIATAPANAAPYVEALDAAGLPPALVTGGGTGSHLLDLEDKVLTEVQAGSYIFMDEDYRRVDLHGSGADVPEAQPEADAAGKVLMELSATIQREKRLSPREAMIEASRQRPDLAQAYRESFATDDQVTH